MVDAGGYQSRSYAQYQCPDDQRILTIDSLVPEVSRLDSSPTDTDTFMRRLEHELAPNAELFHRAVRSTRLADGRAFR